MIVYFFDFTITFCKNLINKLNFRQENKIDEFDNKIIDFWLE